MDKLKIREELLKIEKNHITLTESNYSDFLSGNELIRGEVLDPDDHSHHDQALDVSKELDAVIHTHEEHLGILKKLSFEPTDIVEPGAIVSVNGRCMIIAVSKPQFEIDGRKFIGVSTEAPIYQCLKGKKVGDNFIFNQRKFTIEAVN